MAFLRQKSLVCSVCSMEALLKTKECLRSCWLPIFQLIPEFKKIPYFFCPNYFSCPNFDVMFVYRNFFLPCKESSFPQKHFVPFCSFRRGSRQPVLFFQPGSSQTSPPQDDRDACVLHSFGPHPYPLMAVFLASGPGSRSLRFWLPSGARAVRPVLQETTPTAVACCLAGGTFPADPRAAMVLLCAGGNGREGNGQWPVSMIYHKNFWRSVKSWSFSEMKTKVIMDIFARALFEARQLLISAFLCFFFMDIYHGQLFVARTN